MVSQVSGRSVCGVHARARNGGNQKFGHPGHHRAGRVSAVTADVEALVAEGVSRGRIWTARELQDILSIPGITKAGARTVAAAKLFMDGDVTVVRSA